MLSSLSRKFAALLLAATLASPMLLTGCRSRGDNSYNRWEQQTHRQHVDLDKRSADEQKEYRDWRQRQDHH